MAQYRYTGPGPLEVPVDKGMGLIRPGDVWEFAEEPGFGLWEPLEPQSPESASEATPTETPAGDADSAPTAESAPSSTQEA